MFSPRRSATMCARARMSSLCLCESLVKLNVRIHMGSGTRFTNVLRAIFLLLCLLSYIFNYICYIK